MLGSRADAEDIAQQAFVDAFNALERFDGEGRHHAFSTWLLRIAVNRSKDVLKSKRRTEQPLEHDVGGGEAAFAYDPSTPEANAAGSWKPRCCRCRPSTARCWCSRTPKSCRTRRSAASCSCRSRR